MFVENFFQKVKESMLNEGFDRNMQRNVFDLSERARTDEVRRAWISAREHTRNTSRQETICSDGERSSVKHENIPTCVLDNREGW